MISFQDSSAKSKIFMLILRPSVMLPVLLLMILSSLIRFRINFLTDFMPGNNGAFYLVQVRSILETGKLEFMDFPLVFWIQSFLTIILHNMSSMSIEKSIDFTLRAFDSIIPALSIFPAVFLVKEILNKNSSIIIVLITAGISVFHFSFFNLISEFQKNSFGILLMFIFLLYVYQISYSGNPKNKIVLAILFLLIGITHFGCLLVTSLFVSFYLAIRIVAVSNRQNIFRAIMFLIVFIISCFAILYFVAPFRAAELMEIPHSFFSDWMIIKMVNVKSGVTTLEIAGLIFNNVLSVSILILYIRKRKHAHANVFVPAAALTLLFLSSPFISTEYSNRLFSFSYIFIVPLTAYGFNQTTHKKRTALLVVVLLLQAVSIYSTLIKPVHSNMDYNTSYEMNELNNKLEDKQNSIIIARHGMEFWAAWYFRIDAIRQEQLTPNFWKGYSNVYFLVQKRNISFFGYSSIIGAPFREPSLPLSSELIAENSIFNLYLSKSPPDNFLIFKRK